MRIVATPLLSLLVACASQGPPAPPASIDKALPPQPALDASAPPFAGMVRTCHGTRGGVAAKLTIEFLPPNYLKRELAIEGFPQPIVEVWDGSRMVRVENGAARLLPAEAARLLWQAGLDEAAFWREYEREPSLIVQPAKVQQDLEWLPGTAIETWSLTFPRAGYLRRLHFADRRLVAMSGPAWQELTGERAETEWRFLEPREVHGRLLPGRIEVRAAGAIVEEWTVDSWEFDALPPPLEIGAPELPSRPGH